ncbi:hypothetical protein PIB30_005318 [Stylosanthes scabra]|uniref:Uncharacterized protein n=1 Tax=Stylosanthes scabra TaxID=79078 RepID=A0ABU6V2W0_9FABA|nr:hypothetical protein [Stylosanthes scabra]
MLFPSLLFGISSTLAMLVYLVLLHQLILIQVPYFSRFFGFQMLSAEDKLDGSSCLNAPFRFETEETCIAFSPHIARCALYLRFGQVVAIAVTSDFARKTSNEKEPVIVLLVVVFYSAVH